MRARAASADVDDILQMAAVRAVERAASLDDPTRVRTWLFAIHRNLITDTLRQQSRRERLQDAMAAEEVEAVPVVADHCDCSVIQAQQLRPAYGRSP